MQQPPRPHVVMLPCGGVGHLRPMFELGRRLELEHDVAVTMLTSPWMFMGWRDSALAELQSRTEMGRVTLPDVSLTAEEMEASAGSVEAVVALLVRKTNPHVAAALRRLAPVAALITDLFSTDAFSAAADNGGVPVYVFFPSNASMCSLMLHFPAMAPPAKSFQDEPDVTLEIPGLPFPIAGRDMPTPLQVCGSRSYEAFSKHCRRLGDARGILVNTFAKLEPAAVSYLRRRLGPASPEVYAVGPILYCEATASASASVSSSSACLEWLQAQPTRSVVVVSFGSGGRLQRGQVVELARGLEKSGQRFLWVLRRPGSDDTQIAVNIEATELTEAEATELLPHGFLERTAERGLVVLQWIPQRAVIGHAAVAGFVTHCGWNTTLECVYSGVPVVPWPLFAEQHMNRMLLLHHMRVAVDLTRNDKGFATAECIEEAITELMLGPAGAQARDNAQRLSLLAKAALVRNDKDEQQQQQQQGDSFQELARAVASWTRNTTSSTTTTTG